MTGLLLEKSSAVRRLSASSPASEEGFDVGAGEVRFHENLTVHIVFY